MRQPPSDAGSQISTDPALRGRMRGVTRRTPDPSVQPALLPTPEQHERPNAGHLVAAWCAAYSEQRHGSQPHPSILKRVAGVCRTVGRDCGEDLDAWRSAWRACSTAGRAGRFDIVPFLADDQPRSLYPVRTTLTARQIVLGRMQAIPGEVVREIG